MKKFVYCLVAAVIAAACSLTLAACAEAHTHVFSDAWVGDESGHHHECTAGDGGVTETEQHVYDENYKCTACNYQHEHDFAWGGDRLTHYEQATCHPEVKRNEGPHVDADSDGKCDECGSTDIHIHTYADEYSYDAENHWYAPTCTDTTEPSGLEAHTFTEGVCECGVTESAIAAFTLVKRYDALTGDSRTFAEWYDDVLAAGVKSIAIDANGDVIFTKADDTTETAYLAERTVKVSVTAGESDTSTIARISFKVVASKNGEAYEKALTVGRLGSGGRAATLTFLPIFGFSGGDDNVVYSVMLATPDDEGYQASGKTNFEYDDAEEGVAFDVPAGDKADLTVSVKFKQVLGAGKNLKWANFTTNKNSDIANPAGELPLASDIPAGLYEVHYDIPLMNNGSALEPRNSNYVYFDNNSDRFLLWDPTVDKGAVGCLYSVVYIPEGAKTLYVSRANGGATESGDFTITPFEGIKADGEVHQLTGTHAAYGDRVVWFELGDLAGCGYAVNFDNSYGRTGSNGANTGSVTVLFDSTSSTYTFTNKADSYLPIPANATKIGLRIGSSSQQANRRENVPVLCKFTPIEKAPEGAIPVAADNHYTYVVPASGMYTMTLSAPTTGVEAVTVQSLCANSPRTLMGAADEATDTRTIRQMFSAGETFILGFSGTIPEGTTLTIERLEPEALTLGTDATAEFAEGKKTIIKSFTPETSGYYLLSVTADSFTGVSIYDIDTNTGFLRGAESGTVLTAVRLDGGKEFVLACTYSGEDNYPTVTIKLDRKDAEALTLGETKDVVFDGDHIAAVSYDPSESGAYTLEISSAEGLEDVTVYDESTGAVLFAGGNLELVTLTASKAVSYAIVYTGSEGKTVSLKLTSPASATALTADTEKAVSFADGNAQYFAYTATAAGKHMLVLGGESLTGVTVYDAASGDVLITGGSSTLMTKVVDLKKDDKLSVLVTYSGDEADASVNLTVVTPAAALSATVADTTTVSLASGKVAAYRFMASASAQYTMTIAGTSLTGLTVYNADGSTLGARSVVVDLGPIATLYWFAYSGTEEDFSFTVSFEKYLPPLATPTNVTIKTSSNMLVWTAVPNATGYKITQTACFTTAQDNGTYDAEDNYTTTVTECSYNIRRFGTVSTMTVVATNADGEYQDSTGASVTYMNGQIIVCAIRIDLTVPADYTGDTVTVTSYMVGTATGTPADPDASFDAEQTYSVEKGQVNTLYIFVQGGWSATYHHISIVGTDDTFTCEPAVLSVVQARASVHATALKGEGAEEEITDEVLTLTHDAKVVSAGDSWNLPTVKLGSDIELGKEYKVTISLEGADFTEKTSYAVTLVYDPDGDEPPVIGDDTDPDAEGRLDNEIESADDTVVATLSFPKNTFGIDVDAAGVTIVIHIEEV